MNVNQYRRLQDAGLRPLMQLLRALLRLLGVPVTDAQVDELAVGLWRPTLRARDLSYAAAVRYLSTQDLPPTLVVPLPRDYPFAATRATIEDTVRHLRVVGDPITPSNRHDPRVVKAVEQSLAGPLTRHAQEPARETIQGIGEDEDHEHVGWARVLVGAYSCAFCAMLASRGPVYSSRETAIGRGGNPLDLYHAPYVNKNGNLVGGNCDCIAVLVKSFTRWEGAAAWEKLEDLWGDTGGKASGKAARLAFRREWDRQVRAGDTGKYLVDSVQPRRAAA